MHTEAVRRARARGGGDPLDQRRLVRCARMAGAAGDDQRVELARRAAPATRRASSVSPLEVRSGAPSRLSDRDLVAGARAAACLDQRLRAGEHLQRPGDVEALHAGVGEDRDLAGSARWWHEPIMTEPSPVRKDRFPTISAIARDRHCDGRAFCPAPRNATGRGAPARSTMAPMDEPEFERDRTTSTTPAPTRSAPPPGRVASIVGAAEHAAADLREQAEARARERIAEADRAADIRVQAAEEEAEEILASARARRPRRRATRRWPRPRDCTPRPSACARSPRRRLRRRAPRTTPR